MGVGFYVRAIAVSLAGVLILAAAPAGLTGQATAQVASTSTFAAGGQELFSLEFSNSPVGAFPSDRITRLSGAMEVVMKDGKRMLRATELSELLITLPNGQILPEKFTIEVDLIPKECCPPTDLTLEGTPRINQGQASAHLLWTGDGTFGWVGVVGGAQENREFQIPDAIRATLPGTLSRVGVSFDGNTITMYTNGSELYTVQAHFLRGPVLRVTLGGLTDENKTVNPVYLARVRIATGAPVVVAQQQSGMVGTGVDAPPPITGLIASVGSQGDASASWSAVPGATSYFVVRWKSDDAVCCSNFSSPAGMNEVAWADGVLPMAGTYTYRLYATTAAGISVGETTAAYQPAVVSPPTGVNKTGVDPSRIPAPQTIPLSEVSAAGLDVLLNIPKALTIELGEIRAVGATAPLVPAPQAIVLPPVIGVGSARTSTRATAASSATTPAPWTVELPAVVGMGARTGRPVPTPQTIAIAPLTASGAATTRIVVVPLVINLAGVTGVGAARRP